MKLNKFNKNKKQKKIIITSVIGILFVTGAIFLYRTYAYYEEKKTYNVLQGKVGDFNTSDIELALTLDGEKVDSIPKIDSTTNGGYSKIEADCGDTADITWDINEWGALITNIRSSKVQCNISFKTFYNSVNIGDYISYTPSITSYTITQDLTGYSNDQTINPSELNLWRVIRKNDDGTIDIVSEYISSTKVIFYGVTGFRNLVGSLNTIAQLYETDGITSGSRYLGYNGQIENCMSSSENDCPTDALYTTDINLVTTAVGNLIGYYVSSPNSKNVYWLAGRFWRNSSIMCGSVVNGSGNVSVYYGSNYLADISGNESNSGYPVRPIVTLKSGLSATGSGTSESPYILN